MTQDFVFVGLRCDPGVTQVWPDPQLIPDLRYRGRLYKISLKSHERKSRFSLEPMYTLSSPSNELLSLVGWVKSPVNVPLVTPGCEYTIRYIKYLWMKPCSTDERRMAFDVRSVFVSSPVIMIKTFCRWRIIPPISEYFISLYHSAEIIFLYMYVTWGWSRGGGI